ncbi:hypothetical protein JCM8097_009268 [Rhodosporidiobolus ruineniae]
MPATNSEDDQHRLETPHLESTVLSHGHILHSLVAKPNGHPSDLLVGFANPADHHHATARTFFNCAVGRYANRLPSGEIKLATGAKIHASGAEGVCLHGGESGFDTLPWTPIPRSESSLFDVDDPQHTVPPPPSDPAAPITESTTLHRLYSPAGADGFPCSLEVEALVTVLAPKVEETEAEGRKGRSVGKVKVVFRAKIREDGDEGIDKGTPVNLTLHWGFRLDDCKDPDVLGHRLFLASDKLVALDDLGLSTGEIDAVEKGSQYDFYSSGLDGEHRTIGEQYDQEKGIDRNFLFNTPPPSLHHPSGSARLSTTPQAILTSPTSAAHPYQLRFTSNQPSVQVYTAAGLDGSGPARKEAHGGPSEAAAKEGQPGAVEGRGYGKHGAVFLEFHAPVGAVVHAASASGKEETPLGAWLAERAEVRKADEEGRGWERDTVLRRGQVYENWVECEVLAV